MTRDKREDALRYLDMIDMLRVVYGVTGFVAFIIITFFDLKYLLPVTGIVVAILAFFKLTMSWEASREVVLRHLSRPRIKAWDGKELEAGWGGVIFGLVVYLIFGVVHLLFWKDHLGRMLQIYLFFSLPIFVDLYGIGEERFKKQAGL